MIMDKIALALLIIGGLNWGSVGLFQFDLVAFVGGGSDVAYDGKGFQLFQFCPVCGSSLLYERPSNNKLPAHSSAPVKVAVDCYGQRIPFAIEEDDCVMSEEEYSFSYTSTTKQSNFPTFRVWFN